ncbi:tRNA(His) guanylyltransferase Thg1 family protein [Bacteroides acidifaciens]|uniref:tRNA(His) guanylyltransferase Thg1 family protein n=1 Tax=Bacteroides acidifaciens TaxID=85831 RepID=UPI00248CD64F|nr:tRNA(His) guanylyltransferase Thg1 family protein [Bacteroides acidifaciens]
MANNKDSLGDRMKGYENISRTYLTRRVPAIIRVDGKAFHTFTKGIKRPFDPIMTKTMQDAMKYLCENIQGCVLGYTQSDEITLVLTDYGTIKTDAWFGYGVQKMCSIAAAMATLAFNTAWRNNVESWGIEFWDWEEGCDDPLAKKIYLTI